MARSRTAVHPAGDDDPRQLPLPGLFSSDPLQTMYLIGELALDLVDLPQTFGRIKLIKKKWQHMEKTWNLRKCDPLRVKFELATGRYTLIDGCHRFLAARGRGLKSLPFRVERDMPDSEAARVFVERAKSVRPISPADEFRNLVIAGDQQTTEVRDILERFGLYVFVDPARTALATLYFPSIATGRSIHQRNGELQAILELIDDAWGLAAAGALRRELLLGISQFWVSNHRALDRAGLVARLKATDPIGLVHQADQYRGASTPRMTQIAAINDVINQLYYKGRRNGHP